MKSLFRAPRPLQCERCGKKCTHYAYSEKDERVCGNCYKQTEEYNTERAIEEYERAMARDRALKDYHESTQRPEINYDDPNYDN